MDKKALRAKLLDKTPLVILSDIKQGNAGDVLEMLERQHKNLLKRLGKKHAYTAMKRALIGVAHAALGDRKTAFEEFSDSVPYLLSRSRESDSDEDESQSTAAVIRQQVLESYLGLLADLGSSGAETPQPIRWPMPSASPRPRGAASCRRRWPHPARGRWRGTRSWST